MKALFLYHEGNVIMERFYKNLINENFCNVCEECDNCRGDWSYKDDVEAIVIRQPEEEFIEDPEDYIPQLPKADVCIVQLHEDLLYELPYILKDLGYRYFIIPSERPNDLSLAMRKKLKEICSKFNISFYNPKPFCSLKEPKEFIEYFRIGYPKFKITIDGNKIKDIKVLISSPCGESYYIAKRLLGKDINEIKEEIANAHHNYPCLASMEIDKELNDTILHKAGYIALESIMKEIKCLKE
ncbi:hypothetical protein J422_05319 [Methanocaldococcus villosus KIN24-T80]|uniref:Thymidylate synthase n=1 Tax=Methanocaldococcus villosus KIN24-T80 TaxID=1069083 RepID=N6V0Q9_9EURY|nr:DUF166 domain-containing protein [Methanocaldococcus villosus]ENN95898.1 hypothetical protein J422_05319 [Methanocaldococcus villosus KIN24-T80]